MKLKEDIMNTTEITAVTENGAKSNSTMASSDFTKNALVANLEYFAKVGTYRNRPQATVDADMKKMFAENEEVALKLVFASRLITRKPKDADETATGFGQRDEFYKSVTWMANNKSDLLYKNLHLIPLFGSWKDFLNTPLLLALDKQKVFELVKQAISEKDPLVLKFLPQIRSVNSVRTERDKMRSYWAKDLCRFLQISHKQYRKLKSSGSAHIWQRQMSNNDWKSINFNGIPGKAMFNHITQKGKDKKSVFERHGQEDRLYTWAKDQNKVKFTGFPYELLQAASKGYTLIQKAVLNGQFESCLESMKDHKLGNVLCALDTSGSMTCGGNANCTPYDLCLSLGIAFSSLNVGKFNNTVAMFDNITQIVKLKSDNFCDKVMEIKHLDTAWGGTNFQSVIDAIVRFRHENKDAPASEFPETLLVISDMQFNPVDNGNAQTNYEAAMKKLNSVGLGEMRIIWWLVNGNSKDFPSKLDDKGVYMIGGFDPANLKALLGMSSVQSKTSVLLKDTDNVKEETPLDGMINFLTQPIFSEVQY